MKRLITVLLSSLFLFSMCHAGVSSANTDTNVNTAPGTEYIISSNCGPWENGNRACLTVKSSNAGSGWQLIEHVKLCIQGEGYAQPGDVRIYSYNVAVEGYPKKTGDCLNWGKNTYVPKDDIDVQSWGWMGKAGGPVSDFNVWVHIFT